MADGPRVDRARSGATRKGELIRRSVCRQFFSGGDEVGSGYRLDESRDLLNLLRIVDVHDMKSPILSRAESG